MRELFPSSKNILQRLVQIGIYLVLDPAGDAVGCLREASCDSGDRIAVAAKRDGVPNGILKVFALQERDDGLRHAALTGRVKAVCGADLVQSSGEIVAIFPFNIHFDDLFALYRIIPDRCSFSVAVTAKVISA